MDHIPTQTLRQHIERMRDKWWPFVKASTRVSRPMRREMLGQIQMHPWNKPTQHQKMCSSCPTRRRLKRLKKRKEFFFRITTTKALQKFEENSIKRLTKALETFINSRISHPGSFPTPLIFIKTFIIITKARHSWKGFRRRRISQKF